MRKVFLPSLGARYFCASSGPQEFVPTPLMAISRLTYTLESSLSSKSCAAFASACAEYGSTENENGFSAVIFMPPSKSTRVLAK